jgi:PKD repeat protein
LKINYIKIHYLALALFLLALIPTAKAQWMPTAGPYGGIVQAVAVNSTITFAGTNNGVFTSYNNGNSWTAANAGLTSLLINSFAVNGTNTFVGTNSNGVFLSSNGGNTWTSASTGLPNNTYAYALTFSGSNLFVGTNWGVYVTANNGVSWTAANNTSFNTNYVQSFAVSGANIFAGAYGGGVFMSGNNGATWTPVNQGLLNVKVKSLVANGTNLFAGTYGDGVFYSNNNGTSWTAVNSGLPLNSIINSLTVSGLNILAGTNNGVFISANNGSSWTAVNSGLTNTVVNALTVNGTYIFAGTNGGGVFLSGNNGGSWSPVINGITTTNIQSFAVSGNNIFAGTRGGSVFLTVNNGASWTSVSTWQNNTPIYSLLIAGSNIFAGSYGGGVFLSGNNGTSWTTVNTGLTTTNVQSLALSGSSIFAGTDKGVFLSNNNGTTWVPANTGISTFNVKSMAVMGSNIFAGTYANGIYMSVNNGSSWTAVNTGMPASSIINAFAVSGNTIYAGVFNGGVYSSVNNGSSWTAVNTGLPTVFDVYSLAISDTNIFVGTNKGVYLSGNKGSSWKAVSNGLTNLDIYSLAVNGNKVFAGNNQVYSMDIIPLSAKIQKTDAICNGSTTGTATVTAFGGTPPYRYSWNTNPVQNNATATNLPAGTDTALVYDASGFTIKIGTTIYFKASPSSSFTSTSNGNVVNFTVGTPAKGVGYYWDFGDNSYSKVANPTHTYSVAGGYPVILKAMDSTYVSCQSALNKYITAGTGGCTTVADFSLSQDTTAKTVNFTDKSVGTSLKWYWDFGNGESSSLQNPAGYKYLKGGAYTVCLTVRDTVQKCQNVTCHDLKANNVPDCQTKFLFFTDGLSNNVQFDGRSVNTANSYYWSFGNGDYSNQANPLYTYPIAGYYTVCLTTRDSILPGCQSKFCDFVHAGSGDCKAKFNALPVVGSFTVNFNDASVGNSTAWYWDFGDGHVSHLQNPSYKYSSTGFYKVCLTVSKKGCQDTYCNTVHVGNNDCKTSFSYFTDPVKQSTEFKDLSLSSPAMWSWEFGDGTSSNLQNPKHTYTYSGIYTSCLSTLNGAGCISHSCEDITVGLIGKDCQAAFETFENNDSVVFKNKSIGTADTWFWDFGDNTQSTLQHPTHSYSADGYYTVSLTMYNSAGGCFNTAYNKVSIGNAAPDKDCKGQYSYLANAANNLVNFRDESVGNPVSWEWNFSDSTTSSLQHPAHTFKRPGFYQVCLTIKSSNGSSNVYCNEVGIGQTGLGAGFVYKENTTYFFKNTASYPISFYGSAYGKPSKWLWDFGDKSYDSLRINVTHGYASAGSYNACLTISDATSHQSSLYCKVVKTGSVQGIKEHSVSAIDLNVYPNPMSSHGIVSYFIEKNEEIQLSLFDLQGRRLKVFSNGMQQGLINQAIDITDTKLSTGLYLIQLTVNGKLYTKPIIVNR